jgi:hypothetical protein
MLLLKNGIYYIKRNLMWTSEQITKLEKLVEEGRNFEEIALLLGKTISEVRMKTYNLGLIIKRK